LACEHSCASIRPVCTYEKRSLLCFALLFTPLETQAQNMASILEPTAPPQFRSKFTSATSMSDLILRVHFDSLASSTTSITVPCPPVAESQTCSILEVYCSRHFLTSLQSFHLDYFCLRISPT